MQEWAAWLYNSTAWKKCREAYRRSVFGICEKCGGAGEIVHHIIPLTPENIRDCEVTMSFGNLRLLCRDCHAAAHGNNDNKLVGGGEIRFNEFGDVVYIPPYAD